MTLGEFQRLIEKTYYERDAARGLEPTFMWFCEEVGELAAALRSGDAQAKREEFADCLAWLSTMASICGVDLEDAAAKYASGCPSCGRAPCRCPRTKP